MLLLLYNVHFFSYVSLVFFSFFICYWFYIPVNKRKFLQKFCLCDNTICETLAFMAKDELSSLRSAS